ncbi:MAG: ABC transporter ATP-binding protein [Chloroflexi bacterium]|nr:ABC transporter ATP-binding protein [Chloroflexota bacterium]
MNRPAWRYLFGLYRDDKFAIALSVAAAIGQSLALVPIAALVRRALDESIPQGRTGELLLMGALMLALYMGNAGLNLFSRNKVYWINKHAVERLRQELIKKYYAFSRTQLYDIDRSLLHTVLVEEANRIDQMVSSLLANFLPAFFVSLFLGGMLIYLNWQLFVTLVLVVPGLVFLIRRLGRRLRGHVRAFHRSFEVFIRGVRFFLRTIDLTQTQAAVAYETRRQFDNLSDLREKGYRFLWMTSVYRTSQDLLVTSAGVLVLFMGGWGVISGWISMGEVISFYVTLALLTRYLSSFLGAITDIVVGNESLTTLYDLLKIEPAPPYRGADISVFQGRIRFEGVSFAYSREHPIFVDCNLDIPAGMITSISGPNGSGKTTLINLILGFYRPDSGALYADGLPYETLDVAALRRQIGVVPQNPLLFSATVSENIAYGFVSVDEAELEEAALSATALDFVRELPQGFETLVGEDALFLSGGQRQRLAIARALLIKPRFLILDEPTNHLDVPAVDLLMENLRALPYKPTILLISHDPEVVKHADHKFMLRDREIFRVEAQELLERTDRSTNR